MVSTTADTHCGEGIVEVQLPSTPAFPLSQRCLRFSPSPGRVHTHGKLYRPRRGPKVCNQHRQSPLMLHHSPPLPMLSPKKFPGPSSKSTFPEGGGGVISAKAAWPGCPPTVLAHVPLCEVSVPVLARNALHHVKYSPSAMFKPLRSFARPAARVFRSRGADGAGGLGPGVGGLGLVNVVWWRGWTGTSTAVLREHTWLCGTLLRGLQGTEVDMRAQPRCLPETADWRAFSDRIS